jgi:hypothetical protein
MGTWIDHLVLAAPSLDAGTRRVSELTGVTPEFGGVHTGRGTHNALASLGPPSYLEVIAPDPEQPGVGSPLIPDDLADGPRLVAFAVGCDDLDAAVTALRHAGVPDVADPYEMSRARPDGRVLTWRLAFVGSRVGGAHPFLISWDGDDSPTHDSPPAGRLVALAAGDPEPGPAAELLTHLGVAVDVDDSPTPWLRATIETPSGQVVLT